MHHRKTKIMSNRVSYGYLLCYWSWSDWYLAPVKLKTSSSSSLTFWIVFTHILLIKYIVLQQKKINYHTDFILFSYFVKDMRGCKEIHGKEKEKSFFFSWKTEKPSGSNHNFLMKQINRFYIFEIIFPTNSSNHYIFPEFYSMKNLCSFLRKPAWTT